MAEGSGSWFLVNDEWCDFYHVDAATGWIYPIALKNLNNYVGCSTAEVDAALRANAEFFHYNMKAPDGKPGSPYTFYVGDSKYGLNPNNGSGVQAQISNWNHGTDYGKGGRYSACALHIYMHARGLDPTIANTIAMLQARSGKAVYYADSMKKRREIESEVIGAALAAGNARPEFRESKAAPAAEVKRGIHYGETAIMVYNENGRRIQEGIRTGEIEFPTRNEETGRITIPKLLLNIFRSRGITKPYKIPFEELSTIGICYGENRYLKKNGIKLLRTGGEEYKFPLRGVLFLQDPARDDDGNVFFSAQIRNTDYNYNLITRAKEKETGALRFTNGGPASPIGLERALNARPELGVFIFEGAFDRIALLSVSHGGAAAVATQGAKNHRYLLEKADRFRENGQIVVLAYDDDKTGTENNESLLNALREKKVQAVRWCGCFGEKDFNDLLKNRPADAESLADTMISMVYLIRTGYWTQEKANTFAEKVLGSDKELCGTNLTVLDGADFIMHELRSFGEHGGKIQDVRKALDEISRWWVGEQIRLQKAAEAEEVRPLTPEEAVKKNFEILKEARENGSLLIGAVDDKAFCDAYMAKGIDVRKLPEGIVKRLGYITRDGIYPVSTRTGEKSQRPVFGLVAGYDNVGSSYRFSEMIRIPDGENRLICTHEGGCEYTLGKPDVFGLAEAVGRDGKKTPVVVTENIFEALSIMSVSKGRVNAIAVDRAVEKLSDSFVDKAAASGSPVILAADRDEDGIRHFNALGGAFYEKGCRFLYWPVCPAGESISGIIRDDISTGGHKLELLVNTIERLASMAETGRFTGLNTSMFVKAVTNGREVNTYSENAPQYTYACTILKAVESEMNNAYASSEDVNRNKAVEAVLERNLRLFDRTFVKRESAEQTAVPVKGNLSGTVYSVGQDAKYRKTEVSYNGEDVGSVPYSKDTRSLIKTMKMANSASLAGCYSRGTDGAKVLEVSTKSSVPLGIKLSAMNLAMDITVVNGSRVKTLPAKVESIYQAGKVFRNSGSHSEWYGRTGFDAQKAAEAVHKKDELTGFTFGGQKFSKEGGSMFYNWIYVSALCSDKNAGLRSELKNGGWNAFTDIESRPGQYASQAEAVSVYCALERSGKLNEALQSPTAFRNAVISLRGSGGGVENVMAPEQNKTGSTFGITG